MNTLVKCQSLYVFVKAEVIAELLYQMHLDCTSLPNEVYMPHSFTAQLV